MSKTPSLFADDIELEVEAPGSATPTAQGPFAGVALDQSIDRVLDYSIPKSLQTMLHVGQRVVVPLGRKNKPTRGYVVSIHPTTDIRRSNRCARSMTSACWSMAS